MKADFDTLLKSLAKMSAEDLHASARRLALSEKRHAAELICHLVEIMERKVYLELGYANIFEYCVRRLGLSEGAIQLRRHVAGAARRFPQLLEAIADLRINMSVAGKIAPHLTEDNVAAVLADCAGMTKRQAEEYAAAFEARPVVSSGIRRRPQPGHTAVGVTAADAMPTPQQHTCGANAVLAVVPAEPGRSTEAERPVARGTAHNGEPRERPVPSARLEPARRDIYNFRFAANRKFKDALVRLAEVTGLHPERDMAQLLERAVECALEKADPQRKHERRVARQARQHSKQSASKASGTESNTQGSHRPGDVDCPRDAHRPL